jgi:hypothetical protein
MPTVTPQFQSFQGADDGKSKRATAQYLVTFDATDTNPSPEAALYAPGIPRVRQGPVPGDSYPYDDRLRADSKRIAQRLNALEYLVEVAYSNDGSFRFPQPPPDGEVGYKALGSDFGSVVVIVPTFVTRRIRTVDANGQVAETDEYERQDLRLEVTEWVCTRDVELENVTSQTLLAIATQRGYIHEFPDHTQHYFEGATVQQTGPNTWKASYRWRSRQTVPPFEPITGRIVPTFPLFFYEEYCVDFDTRFQGNVPVVSKVSRYNTDHLYDWRTLPGNPIE